MRVLQVFSLIQVGLPVCAFHYINQTKKKRKTNKQKQQQNKTKYLKKKKKKKT